LDVEEGGNTVEVRRESSGQEIDSGIIHMRATRYNAELCIKSEQLQIKHC